MIKLRTSLKTMSKKPYKVRPPAELLFVKRHEPAPGRAVSGTVFHDGGVYGTIRWAGGKGGGSERKIGRVSCRERGWGDKGEHGTMQENDVNVVVPAAGRITFTAISRRDRHRHRHMHNHSTVPAAGWITRRPIAPEHDVPAVGGLKTWIGS